MRKTGRITRWIAGLLVVLLFITPGITVFAYSSGNENRVESNGLNDELLRFLESEYGEEQSLSIWQSIQALGLVDGSGNWQTHPIILDGEEYTLEEIIELLDDETIDLTRVAEVDGTAISLDTLKKIIAIEEDLEAIRKSLGEGEPKITLEHLDGLESLIEQIDSEGLDLSGTSEFAPLTIPTQGDYEDEIYVTVTKYRNWEDRGSNPYLRGIFYVDLTFTLNKAQDKAVSFSYELMEGTLGSIAEDDRTGTIVFQPGESEKLLRLKDGGVPDSYPVSYYDTSAQEYRENVFAKHARVDYIHFYNYQNLDEIRFDVTMEYLNTRLIGEPQPSSNYSVFTHAYNGGAYMAYAPTGGRGDIYTSNPGWSHSFLFVYAGYNGIYHPSMNQELLEVKARSGHYTTGQIIPYQALFSKLVLHKWASEVTGNSPGLILAHEGGFAQPAIVAPSTNVRIYNEGSGIPQGYGALSFRRDYQVVVQKGMQPEGMLVEKSTGQGDPLYYYHARGVSEYDSEYGKIYPDLEWNKPFSNNANITISYARSDAFSAQALTLDKANYEVGDTATITVQLESGDGESDWIKDGALTAEDIGRRMKVSIGDRTRGLVPLDWKRGEDGLPVVPAVLEGKFEITEDIFELMTDDYKSSGQLRAKIYYNRNLSSDGSNIDDFGMLNDVFAGFSVATLKYIYPEDLMIQYPTVWPSGEMNQVFMVSSDSTKLGFTYPVDATYKTEDQFEWRSSNEAVARIMANGTIIPQSEGTVTFTLIARNNGKLNPQTELTTVEISIKAGGATAIVVPDFANKVYVQKNKDATVIWSTNVMSKIQELVDQGTMPIDANFTVELYSGNFDEAQLTTMMPIESWSAPATPQLINANSFTIAGSYMANISEQYTPSYTVRISVPHPSDPGRTLSALAYIIVKSAPAVITLDKSIGQFITDNRGTLALEWELHNFDLENKGEFDFRVTKNGVLLSDSVIIFDQEKKQFTNSAVTETGGRYTLTIDPVTSNGKIKDVYAITLAAKNNLDSTWSYDSLYLQVYKSNALQIQLDGQTKTTYTMSNLDRIKSMTNDERVALNRQITLKNELRINDRDFTDLGEITDQLIWQSSADKVAAINFNSNGIISNITNFNFQSYQPKQSFILSGLENGQTIVAATHAKTGMQTKLNVTVETLKDKLYLFQFYPKTTTTVKYTNGDGEEKSFTSNTSGELGLFDELGVAGDVYVTSEFDNTTYTGVISHESIQSKEQDAAQMELYPINILQLRQLSKVELYFKQSDGSPYTGKVTYRGGVYKNGNYCEATEISGMGVTKQLGVDGKLEVLFDTTDFYSEQAGEVNAATLSAKDQIELAMEFTFEDDLYFPKFMLLDGNSNPIDMVVFGEKIARLIDNPTMQRTSFIANQWIVDAEGGNKSTIDMYTGKFGPNNQFPSIVLTTEFMWWGEEVETEAYAELVDQVGYKAKGQSYQTIKYPFSEALITRHVQVLGEETIWLKKGESGAVHFNLYTKPDQFRKNFRSSATLTNMIGVEDIDADKLREMIDELRGMMQETESNLIPPNAKDSIVGDAFALMKNLNIDVGPLTMKIIPTDDPLVFKTIIATSIGNLPTTEGGDGVGGSSNIEFLKNSGSSLTPGMMDVYRMYKGTYTDFQNNKLMNVLHGKTNGRPLYSFGGYYLGEIRYNPVAGKWENVVLGGGFNAGGGYELNKTVNKMIGPIPVTFTLLVGGAIEVDFKASLLYEQVAGYGWKNPEQTSVNDYLTSLRIVAYIEMFGGIGFDYSVVAAKIGVFGRVTIENTTTWLNRNYLERSGDRVKDGNKLTLEGIVGIRAVVKFLFFSKSYDFASLRYSYSWVFKHWNEIQSYWKEHGNSQLTAANMDMAITAYMNYIGVDDIHVFESNTWEDRSYLELGSRSWNTPNMTFQMRRLDPVNDAPHELQTNAYPYANPQLADDGSLFVYLSDSNSTALEDTVASWAIKVGNSYEDQGAINSDVALQGFGDSNLQVAGEGNLIAAVWVTQKENLLKEAGSEVTNEEIVLMNNSAEIMAAIYDGTNWTTHRLTNNTSPDLAPVVSVGNGKVFVAYRNVYSTNTDNPLDFSEADSIMYTVYDMAVQEWSDAETLYNGTNGTVMGLSAATLGNGVTTVAYNVNLGSGAPLEADYVAGSDNEIVYALVDTDRNPDAIASTWKTKGVRRNLQVTSDHSVNENPQITNIRFADNEERFIVAWYTATYEEGAMNSDIKLLAINSDGELYTEFVDSMHALQSYNEIKIHPNFTFARVPDGYNSIENLSILWKEAELETMPGQMVTRDVIKAVKFGVDGVSKVYLSGAIDVAILPDYTEVDHVDAYVSDASSKEIKALILGTTYTTDAQQIGIITPRNEGEDIEEIPVHISNAVSGMYTATEIYTNKFSADKIVVSPSEIVSGYDLPVQFSIVNQGISKIDTVTIQIDGQERMFSDLAIAPNSSQILIVPYTVPMLVTDPPYEVEALFSDGEMLSVKGELTLDIPDLGLSNIQIIEEVGGQRLLSIPVYNRNSTTLSQKNRVVKLGLYSNTIYTEDYLIGDVIEISDVNDLDLIDQGGFVQDVNFDIQSYLTTIGLTEIPDQGLRIYAHGWVEEADGTAVAEFDESNNDTNIWFERLSLKYNNTGNILLLMEQTNELDHTSVNLSLQNMNMAPISSGNVLLNLLDHDGNIVESQYLAGEAAQLLSFTAEEKTQRLIRFNSKGDAVRGIFFQESADELDATLAAMTLSGVAVNFNPDVTQYALTASDLKKTHLAVAASNSKAMLYLLDKEGKMIAFNQGFLSIDLSLPLTLTEFVVVVEPESAAAEAKEYQFALTSSDSNLPSLELRVEGLQHAQGEYIDQAQVSLTPYEVNKFDIKKAYYRINDAAWMEIAYDGKQKQVITDLLEPGVYTIVAKVQLTSGLEYSLEPVTVEVVTVDAEQSSIVSSNTQVSANGSDEAVITVTVKDTKGRAMADRSILLKVDGGSSVIRTMADVTNSMGEVSFAVNNARAETIVYVAEDAVSKQELASVQIRFIGMPPSWKPNPGSKAEEENGSETDTDSDESADEISIFKENIIQLEELTHLLRERMLKIDVGFNLTDIGRHWAKIAIEKLIRLGAITGYPDGKFKPDQAITRAEFASILVRLFNIKDTGSHETVFTDLQQHWARSMVEILAGHGVVTGYGNDIFKPDATITREEMVVMVMRLLDTEALPQTEEKVLTDVVIAANYAREPIKTAVKAGIVSGYADGSFRPQGQATRAEVTVILLRMLTVEPALRRIVE